MSIVEVCHHRSGVPTDANAKISIFGCEESAGGAHATYKIQHADSPATVELVFQTLERIGLTNEVFAAIIIHRLSAFQRGPFACAENAASCQKFVEGLDILKSRTERRARTGLEGKLAEDKQEEPKHRVRYEGGKLTVGNITVDKDDLATWKQWSIVEAACKQLDPPISALELDVISKVANEIGSAALNGFAEMKSALARTRIVK